MLATLPEANRGHIENSLKDSRLISNKLCNAP
jgi:hypothetical protein